MGRCRRPNMLAAPAALPALAGDPPGEERGTGDRILQIDHRNQSSCATGLCCVEALCFRLFARCSKHSDKRLYCCEVSDALSS